MHLLAAEWLSFSTVVSLLGLLTLCPLSSRVPNALQLLFRYGKTQRIDRKKSINGLISIPKSWFFHFYVFATIFYSFLLKTTFELYFKQTPVPTLLQLLLDAFVGQNRRATVDAASVAIAMVLMFIQVCRRLYECTRLSIYSERGRMALIHYLCGFFFYFGVGLSLLAEAQGFNNERLIRLIEWKECLTLISFSHISGISMFCFASFIQFKSHLILAKLRLDSKGKLDSNLRNTHSIPRGDWFELVSCPHYFAEILIYLSLLIVMGFKSQTVLLLFSFVLTNQVIVGLFNHKWYLERFHDYPKQRKAVFPFLI